MQEQRGRKQVAMSVGHAKVQVAQAEAAIMGPERSDRFGAYLEVDLTGLAGGLDLGNEKKERTSRKPQRTVTFLITL